MTAGGGLRSATVREWLREAGIEYPLVRGGYKAMRRFLLDELEHNSRLVKPVVIGGRTGVEILRFKGEQVLTSAIKWVLMDQKRRIYFTTDQAMQALADID